MEIQGDMITHTSDHFDTLYEYAIKFIKEGNAYADDTEQQQVSGGDNAKICLTCIMFR